MSYIIRRSTLAALLPLLVIGVTIPLHGQTAPSTYNAYTGTDTKVIPPAPALGPANSVIVDPTFGSRILRVTDQNTRGGRSFMPTDAGFHRTWNADSTAIKLMGPQGDGYWLEFDPNTFKVGNGSSTPAIHTLPFAAGWEWSTVDPHIIYYLNGNKIAKYDITTGVKTDLGGPSTGEPVTYMAVVIGQDNWVCSAAGSGVQDSYTKIFCINPISPSVSKVIDVAKKTVNGVAQGDPSWPISAPGQVIGVHSVSGGTGANWLEVTFHQSGWGKSSGSVFDIATNTWSLLTDKDIYWSGHVSMGNGTYANASGSINGRDSRGMVLRNPDNLMNTSEYRFVGQPPNTNNGWCDADHSSWFNSLTNPAAPILQSRYTISSCPHAWTGEILGISVDGSNKVWRFAHNHMGKASCYFADAFAQISNDGKWALFSSYWDGMLGAESGGFGCGSRIDTFIVDLLSAGSDNTSSTPTTGTKPGPTPPPASTPPPAPTPPPTSTPPPANPTPTSALHRVEQSSPRLTWTGGPWWPNNGAFNSGGSATLSMENQARVSFTFTGTAVSWIAYCDEWAGIARVYIDGSLKQSVDTYSSPHKAQSAVYSINGLAWGQHTITIEVTGTKNPNSRGSWIWVDAFDYVGSQ